MTILDTNVLSALMLDTPDTRVKGWLDRQPETSVWTTAISVFEIWVGLQAMLDGKRKSGLCTEFERLLDQIEHRVAMFDEEAAREAADLSAIRRKQGRVGELRDTMIAGIVLARHASIATRNTAHFADIEAAVVNPWTA